MSKRILLAYITENSGHHRASQAVENAIRQQDQDAQILNINGLNYTNPVLEKILISTYMGIIKTTPSVWRRLYDNPKWKKRAKYLQDLIHNYSWPKLDKLIVGYRPDIIACTQAFPCSMIADYKTRTNSHIPLVAVLTDFMPHAYWMHQKIDTYIVACKDAQQRFIKEGVDPAHIHITGIPIDPSFLNVSDRILVHRRLGLTPEIPTVLIMGGGQGLGPIKQTIQELDKIDTPFQTVVVAGTNRILINSLRRIRTDCKKTLVPLGYIDWISSLMDIASVIITKSGGLTTSEALAKGLPVIILKPIPGQEENNANFLVSEGSAVRASLPSDVVKYVKELLTHPSKREQMSKDAKRISFPNSAISAAKIILKI